MSDNEKEYYFKYMIKSNLLIVCVSYPDNDLITNERTYLIRLNDICKLDLEIDTKEIGRSFIFAEGKSTVMVSGNPEKITNFYKDIVNAIVQLYEPYFLMGEAE